MSAKSFSVHTYTYFHGPIVPLALKHTGLLHLYHDTVALCTDYHFIMQPSFLDYLLYIYLAPDVVLFQSSVMLDVHCDSCFSISAGRKHATGYSGIA